MQSEAMVMEPHANKELEPKRNPSWIKPGTVLNPTGRPKGTHNKLSVKSLLAQLSDTIGTSYEQQLAENYREAILSQDRKVIFAYDNLFLSKLLADKISIDVAESQEIIDQKRAAFMGALEAYGQAVVNNQLQDSRTVDNVVITIEPTIEPTVANNENQDGDMAPAHQDHGGEHGEAR